MTTFTVKDIHSRTNISEPNFPFLESIFLSFKEFVTIIIPFQFWSSLINVQKIFDREIGSKKNSDRTMYPNIPYTLQATNGK